MECAADLHQRITVIGCSPGRQVLADRLQYLGSLLDEDLEQFVVHRLFVRWRRQQARRGILRRRVDTGYRGGHHIFKGDLLRLASVFHRFRRQRRELNLRQLQVEQLAFIPAGRPGVGNRLVEQRPGLFGSNLRLHEVGREGRVIIGQRRLLRALAVGGQVARPQRRIAAVGYDRKLRFNCPGIGRLGVEIDFLDQELGRRRDFVVRRVSGNEPFLFGLCRRLIRREYLDLVVLVRHRVGTAARLGVRGALNRIAQIRQAVRGDIENQIALAATIVGQSLQVVLDAGDRIGQGVEALPVRYRLAGQQLFFDVAVAGLQQSCRALQGDHRQAATRLGKQFRHPRQMLVVPLRGNEFDDGVLRLFQRRARFLDHQLMNARYVGRWQMAVFAPLLARAHHAGKRGLDIEQCASDVHQDCIVRLAVAIDQRLYQYDLVKNDPTRLGEAQYRQRVGNLLERCRESEQLGQYLALAANEKIETVLDPDQLLAERGNHRAHGAPVRAGQLRAFLVDNRGVRQRFV